MWTRTYLFLLMVRIYFALAPSYIHPDENFQGPEVIAGMSSIPFPFPFPFPPTNMRLAGREETPAKAVCVQTSAPHAVHNTST